MIEPLLLPVLLLSLSAGPVRAVPTADFDGSGRNTPRTEFAAPPGPGEAAPIDADAVRPEGWERRGFAGVSVTRVGAEELYEPSVLAKATHVMDLTFLLFRGAGWTREQLLGHLREVARIYDSDTCRILVRKALIVETDPYRGFLDVDWATVYAIPDGPKGRDLEIAKALPAGAPRPVVVLMRSSYQMHTAYSAPKSGLRWDFQDPLLNTVWIMSAVNSENYARRIPPGYDPIAHELAHVLGDYAGHDQGPEPSIMSDDFDKVNDRILPSQCEQFKRSPLVEPLDGGDSFTRDQQEKMQNTGEKS